MSDKRGESTKTCYAYLSNVVCDVKLLLNDDDIGAGNKRYCTGGVNIEYIQELSCPAAWICRYVSGSHATQDAIDRFFGRLTNKLINY